MDCHVRLVREGEALMIRAGKIPAEYMHEYGKRLPCELCAVPIWTLTLVNGQVVTEDHVCRFEDIEAEILRTGRVESTFIRTYGTKVTCLFCSTPQWTMQLSTGQKISERHDCIKPGD